MRTGDEPEARRVLERTFKAFPFDRVTFNLLALLDKLEKFEVVQDGDLVFKFDPGEAKVLREYAIPLAQDALKKLSAAYQFTPKGPILIEVFPVHDDFAVRNLGLPGLVGALGACFGRVVSMDSPRAKAPGTFSWQATLWHELAHVITLQMSNQRVPRWLTEGISVYEEGRERPVVGPRHGSAVRAGARARAGAEAARSELGLHQAGHHRARVLPGVARSSITSSQRAARRRCARWCESTATASKGMPR